MFTHRGLYSCDIRLTDDALQSLVDTMAEVQHQADDAVLEAADGVVGGEQVPVWAIDGAEPVLAVDGAKPAENEPYWLRDDIGDRLIRIPGAPLLEAVDVRPPQLDLKLLAVSDTKVTAAKIRSLLRDPRLPLLGRPAFAANPDLEWNSVYNNDRPAIEQWMTVREDRPFPNKSKLKPQEIWRVLRQLPCSASVCVCVCV